MSTGDEVVEPDTETLEHGQIRDSNRAMLFAACQVRTIAGNWGSCQWSQFKSDLSMGRVVLGLCPLFVIPEG
jgi:hypothetical protein